MTIRPIFMAQMVIPHSHLTKLLYRWATAIRSISPACFVNITASHRANIANAMRK
ncbi:hypothetical protein UUU_01890 [Klebsiella pneumoniae subsp. pneumoniae DSM 30104 = JCM 1662 = NBRC 14940]|nr:hypothetical protein UUU_01890 [Klebsiella pneumoniae subsp. pneumoniae DSM 30104 = JCM 1662 = NBRC 14940]